MSDVCGGCKQPLVSGRIVKALERRWHKDCFKCRECKQPILDPTFTELDNQPLCAKCAESKGGIRENDPCGICGAKLGPESVEHPLTKKLVHGTCLRCAICQKVLDTQVVMKDKELCHPGCAQQSLAKPCVVCGKALHGTTFTVEGRSYHQTCFADWSNQARKVQALVRGRLERKGVALEKTLSKTSVTDSSITPARARRLSGLGGPPPLAAAPKTPMLPSVPEDGSFTKHSPKTAPPPPSVPSTPATTAMGPRSPSPASRTVAPPPPSTPRPPSPSQPTAATTASTTTSTPASTAPITQSPKPPPPPLAQTATQTATTTTETKAAAESAASGSSGTQTAQTDTKLDSKEEMDLEALRQKEAEAKAKRQKTKDENWGTEAQIDEEEVYEEPPLPTTIQGLRIELAHCTSLLSSLDGDWGLRVRALHRIEALVSFVSLPMPESTATDPQSWAEQIALFQPHFAVQVNELRSSIVRETCRLLISLSKILGTGMSGCIVALIPNIIANSYVTVKVIRESSITCTSELITRVPSVTYLPPLLNLLNDAHAPARASATKHIGDVLQGDEAVCLSEHKDVLDQVLTIIPKVFEDKDPEVRKNSIFLFKEYKKRFPDKADSLFPTLSARAQKAIGGTTSSRETAPAAKRAPFRPPGLKAKPSDEKGEA